MIHALQDIAPGFHIRQYRRARFDRLISPLPAVIRVEAGEKRLSVAGASTCATGGMLVLLPEQTPLLVENLPPDHGPYVATALAFPRAVFDAAYARLGRSEPAPGRINLRLYRSKLRPMTSARAAWNAKCRTHRPGISRHAKDPHNQFMVKYLNFGSSSGETLG